MLEITIKDTETGEVMHRTTELVALCVKADSGTLGMTLGHGTPATIANFALALDRVIDDLLDGSGDAAEVYRMSKQDSSHIQVKELTVDCFSDR